MSENSDSHKIRRKKRDENFTAEQKVALADEVRKWPAIWNSSSLDHASGAHRVGYKEAWSDVANKLNKSVAECQLAWVALRESYRYRVRASKRKRNSDRAQDEIDWKPFKHLTFLGDVCRKNTIKNDSTLSAKRKPRESVEVSVLNEASNHCEFTISKTSSPSPTPEEETKECALNRSSMSTPADEVALLTQIVTEVVEQQKQLLQSNNSKAQVSPFANAFAGFTWLLEKLPQNVADNACMDFSTHLINLVKTHTPKTEPTTTIGASTNITTFPSEMAWHVIADEKI